MLEEGRGVFWSQTLQLRASGLDHIHQDDRHELQRIFGLLEEGINRIDAPNLSVAQRESQAEARRQFSEQADELIAKLRSQPGLARLLMPPAFSSLIQRIPQGFVVMLLASDLGHRALILRRDYSSVRSIELEPSVSGLLSEITRTTLPRDWDGPHDVEQDIDVQRLKMVKSKPNHSVEPLVSTLANLWSSVVKPVIEALGLKVSGSLPPRSALMLLTLGPESNGSRPPAPLVVRHGRAELPAHPRRWSLWIPRQRMRRRLHRLFVRANALCFDQSTRGLDTDCAC
jgi:hypothetical protein